MKIFTHLTEKDLFAELYRDALAKRLLSDKSSSMEMEKAMITKLKQSQGPPFTSKIEVQITRDILNKVTSFSCRE